MKKVFILIDNERNISKKLGLKLKKLGFDWLTFKYYLVNDKLIHQNPIKNHNKEKYSISAPTLSLTQKWFIKKHKIIVYVIPTYDSFKSIIKYDNKIIYISTSFEEYDDALENGLNMGVAFLENDILK